MTSGLSDGSCTRIRTRAADVARTREIMLILRRLSPSANKAFPRLQAAETAFEKARGAGEVDLSGASRAAFQLMEKAKLAGQLLINVRLLEKKDIPVVSPADLALLNRTLNETYQRIQLSPAGKWEYGTISPEGIRDVERQWIALIGAWTAFARAARPNISESRIRAQLIRLRLDQLRSIEAN